MATFDIEFNKLILKEGGYVNDSDDSGGETYLGISRNNNPCWAGWNIIDEYKKNNKSKTWKQFTKILKNDYKLTSKAKHYYKNMYWDIIELDDLNSQKIAHELFDTCVNCGVGTAIGIAQSIVGMSVTNKWSKALKYKLMQYDN